MDRLLGGLETLSYVCLILSLLVIFYHYLAYPVIVFVAASVLGKKVGGRSKSLPKVSLVIAAFDEEAVIADKLRNSLALDYPDFEIVVVADGSSDRTVERLVPFADRGIVVLHDKDRAGKAAALNRGVAAATGEILVFSDANAIYDSSALKALVAAFADKSVGAVSGRKFVKARREAVMDDAGFGNSEGLYWKYENLIRLSESRLGTTVASIGEIFAIRRDAFHPFPPGVVNDDAHLTLDVLRQGLNVRYAPEARSEELASLSVMDERLRRRRIAAGRWQLLSDLAHWPTNRPFVLLALVSHKGLRLMMPLAFALAFCANLALVLTGKGGVIVAALFVVQIAFYGISLAGGHADSRRGPLWKLSRLCHFVVSSNVSIMLGFIDWLNGRQSALWTKAAR